VTGRWWLDLLVSLALALAATWLALVVPLVVVRPRGGLLSESLRLLPDVLRVVRHLAADAPCPAGSACAWACSWSTWLHPWTSSPMSYPLSATPRTPSLSPGSCVQSSDVPASRSSAPTGPAPPTGSPP